MTSAEARMAGAGLAVLVPPPLRGPIVRVKRSGRYLYVSGQGPLPRDDGTRIAGKVGGAVSPEDGYRAARLVGLGLLGAIRQAVGSLDRVANVVKVLGMVNCAPGFTGVSQVINGCSDLFVEVFGEEIGRHARSAVGVAERPNDYPVEIEVIVESTAEDTTVSGREERGNR